MIIGYDAKRLFNNFTGLGNYSRFIVKGIHQHFTEEQLYLFTPKVKDHPEVKEFLQEPSYHVMQPTAWLQLLRLGSFWRTALLAREARHQGLDVFHGLSHELPRGIAKVCKAVVTIHDLIFLRYPQFYSSIDRWIYTKKVKHACQEAHVIVAISEQTKNDLIELLGVPEAKIKVVYQGCHPNFKRSFDQEALLTIRKKYALPDRFLLNVGTIEPRKNALLILQAYTHLPEAARLPLVMVGRPTAYLQTIKDFAKEHQLEAYITYLHTVAFQDLPAIYKMSEAFIYPSIFEGFGIPLVEAITCKIPVITSTGSCFSEAAGPHALYVPPTDDAALAQAIQIVCQDTTKRQQMIEGSLQYIERFSEERIAKDMMDLYRSVL